MMILTSARLIWIEAWSLAFMILLLAELNQKKYITSFVFLKKQRQHK